MNLWKPFKRLSLLAPVLLGIAGFYAVVGPRALYPTNIAWLDSGDPAQHFLGWHFFRNSGWSFPIGLNPSYGLELSNSIVFSDSNPLLAFAFKPFASLLPETFQYIGIWLLACFILQAWFAWKLVGLISDRPVIRFLGAGLFVFAPPMLWRLHVHSSLAGHFLLLAAIYLSLRRSQERRAIGWGVVLAVAALVHAYLLAMVATLWLADLTQALTRRDRPVKLAAAEFAGFAAVVGLLCWQSGYFAVSGGVSAVGFGFYRLNLLSLVDASSWSYLLKDLPEEGGDYEGFNYLGLGIISLAFFALPAAMAGRTGLLARAGQKPFLLLALLGFSLFAVSNKVGIGTLALEYPLAQPLQSAANVFRASGRMFWPVFYVLVLAVVFIVVRGNSPRGAAALLTIALVMQVTDTRAMWGGIRKKLMAEPTTTWATPLTSSFWTQAASRYKKVRRLPPVSVLPHWQTLAAYAGRHGLGTDAVYLARISARKVERAQTKASVALSTGRYEADSLYVLDAGSAGTAVLSIDPATDLLARIDGFTVVAPGWKQCAECGHLDKELKVADFFPPIKVGERIQFAQAGGKAAYLLRGWSGPEVWGTWSDGPVAEIVLPLTTDSKAIVIEANALVTPAHPRQRVEIWMNGTSPVSLDLTTDVGHRMELPLSDAVRSKVAERGFLRLEFRLPDAVRPKDIGLNSDTRSLALGLVAITVH